MNFHVVYKTWIKIINCKNESFLAAVIMIEIYAFKQVIISTFS